MDYAAFIRFVKFSCKSSIPYANRREFRVDVVNANYCVQVNFLFASSTFFCEKLFPVRSSNGVYALIHCG